jgi:hypothetical protein
LTRQDKSAPKFPDLVHHDFTTRVDVYAPATYAAKRTDHGRSKSNGQSFLQNLAIHTVRSSVQRESAHPGPG